MNPSFFCFKNSIGVDPPGTKIEGFERWPDFIPIPDYEEKMDNKIPIVSKEIFISCLETLKNCEPGTPEFEFAYQMIITYKIFVDRKEGRIIPKPRFLGVNE
jgi:hypothetical protein